MLRHAFPRVLARTALPVAAIGCIVALAVLSWIPKGLESRTGLPGQLEHVIAYLGTAFIACLAWRRRSAWWTIGLLTATAAVLEAGQLAVPGRTAQLVDLAASVAGALAGIVAALPLRRWIGEPTGRRTP